jgi:hypothetical protein
MPRISRSTLVISIAVLIALVVTACEAAADKPTAEPEPPTPVPTVANVVTEAADNAGSSSGISIREALGDPEVLECIAEQLGVDAEDLAAGIGPELLGRLGPTEISMLETCGFDAGQRDGGGFRVGGGLAGGAFADPEVRECLTGILGEDALDNLGQGSGLGLDPESLAAFEECGLNFGDGTTRRFGGGGGGGFVGSGIADPEIRECLTGILGDDAFDNLGQGSGLGLDPESLAAFEECGLNFGDAGGGGFRFGGREGTLSGDSGIFGGGQRGGFLDGSFQECLTEELGEGALAALRNSEGAPSEELQAALAKCGGEAGDGAGSISIEPAVEPTATSIPVSELTDEQLTCLNDELEPSGLASAVIATSSGDLSELSDEILAALQTCGVGV